jgi:molybdopterin-binding protein
MEGSWMQLSVRNQLQGKITGIEKGTVMANIKIEVTEPNTITAVITKESAEKLGLAEDEDKAVTNIMKKEINHNAPHPSYINLLPLLKK